jgi:Ca-activated chloride channel family protein
MKRLVFAFLFALAAAHFVQAQSGRKLSPTPRPSPAATPDDATQYSESKPQPGRTARFTERFPGIGSGITSKVLPPANSTTAKPDEQSEGEVLKIETNLITIPVSVFDRNGLYIPGLRQNSFKIFEDGVEQEIAYFGTTDKPFTVALLLDTSPSTSYKIDEIHQAAAAFVEQLGPQDSVLVIEFNSSVKLQTEATTDRARIYKAINRAKFGDGTSLYNAVDEALRKQLGKISGRKAVVLFTDGVDTTSRKNSYDSTLAFAEESDSLIFPIYYNTYLDNLNRSITTFPGPWGGPPARGVTREDYALGRKYLEDLADATGGRVFRPEATPGGLTAAFEGIAEELRRQYNVGYVPKDEGKPGQRKLIKVRVDRPNLIIRARDSYVVGATAANAPPELQKPGN